jgi:hypothetical protein
MLVKDRTRPEITPFYVHSTTSYLTMAKQIGRHMSQKYGEFTTFLSAAKKLNVLK